MNFLSSDVCSNERKSQIPVLFHIDVQSLSISDVLDFDSNLIIKFGKTFVSPLSLPFDVYFTSAIVFIPLEMSIRLSQIICLLRDVDNNED